MIDTRTDECVNRTSLLMNDERFLEADLRAMRDVSPRVRGTPTQQAMYARHETYARVLAIWAMYDYLQIAGWAEHTCDWDWVANVTMNDGTVHDMASGSSIAAMWFGGVRYATPREASGAWTYATKPDAGVQIEFDAYAQYDEDADNDDSESYALVLDVDNIARIAISRA